VRFYDPRIVTSRASNRATDSNANSDANICSPLIYLFIYLFSYYSKKNGHEYATFYKCFSSSGYLPGNGIREARRREKLGVF